MVIPVWKDFLKRLNFFLVVRDDKKVSLLHQFYTRIKSSCLQYHRCYNLKTHTLTLAGRGQWKRLKFKKKKKKKKRKSLKIWFQILNYFFQVRFWFLFCGSESWKKLSFGRQFFGSRLFLVFRYLMNGLALNEFCILARLHDQHVA